jgi:uncharacterized protein YdeI (YjbR/CyaY-like superfamily)
MELVIPSLLLEHFQKNSLLEEKFKSFTKFKQREFIEYVNSAKKEETKIKRIEKISELISDGIGFKR